MKEKTSQAEKSVLESQEAVLSAARMVGVETENLTISEVSERVIEAAAQIPDAHHNPRYRKIAEVEGFSPLATAVVKIGWHHIAQNSNNR